MNTQSTIRWALVGMNVISAIAVACLGILVLLLHDGAATASVVDTLKWIAITGISSQAAVLGIHTYVTGQNMAPNNPIPAQPSQASPGAAPALPLPAGLDPVPLSP